MLRRIYNPLWLFVAMLFAAQTVTPAMTMVHVSVRCVGGSAAPCAEATMAATDLPHVARHFTGLACCRYMTDCHMTQTSGQSCLPPSLAPTSSFRVSAPRCNLTVRPVVASSPAKAPTVWQWHNVNAPPAVSSVHSFIAPVLTTIVFGTHTVRPMHSPQSSVHGLRAPPAA